MQGTLLKTISADTLHCNASLSSQKIDDFRLDLLIVQARSSVGLDARESILQLEIQDITDGISHMYKVYEYQEPDDLVGDVFIRQWPLSTILPRQSLTTWTTIIQIDTQRLRFARQGLRNLLFKLTLILEEGSQRTESHDLIDYDNPCLGYQDQQENTEHIRLQAAHLAGSLIAQNQKSLNPDQHGLLRGWLLVDVNLSKVSHKGRRTFEKSFKKLMKACRDTELSQIIALSQEITESTTVGQRQEIVEFCFHLIGLLEPLSTTALVTLREIAVIWKIESTQFSILLEKILSIDRLKGIDPTVLLGITEDMPTEHRLSQLNKAYAKWNARVTHADKAVQQQAEEMLSWISQARSQYLRS